MGSQTWLSRRLYKPGFHKGKVCKVGSTEGFTKLAQQRGSQSWLSKGVYKPDFHKVGSTAGFTKMAQRMGAQNWLNRGVYKVGSAQEAYKPGFSFHKLGQTQAVTNLAFTKLAQQRGLQSWLLQSWLKASGSQTWLLQSWLDTSRLQTWLLQSSSSLTFVAGRSVQSMIHYLSKPPRQNVQSVQTFKVL